MGARRTLCFVRVRRRHIPPPAPRVTLAVAGIMSSRSDSDLKQKKMQWLHNVGGNSMALIVDDSEHVWEHAGNLIVVEPYVYHYGSPDVNNAPGGGALPPSNGGSGKASSALSTKMRSEVAREVIAPLGPDGKPVTCAEEGHHYLLDVLRVRACLRACLRTWLWCASSVNSLRCVQVVEHVHTTFFAAVDAGSSARPSVANILQEVPCSP